MVQYFISLIVFFAGICFTVFMSGSGVLTLIDIPSLVIVGILPFVFTGIWLGFKNTVSAFSVPFKKDSGRDELINAKDFFGLYGKTVWIAGFIAVLIGVIAMLKNLEDKTALGPNLALALISLLYSGILNTVIIIPFTALIKRQIKE